MNASETRSSTSPGRPAGGPAAGRRRRGGRTARRRRRRRRPRTAEISSASPGPSTDSETLTPTPTRGIETCDASMRRRRKFRAKSASCCRPRPVSSSESAGRTTEGAAMGFLAFRDKVACPGLPPMPSLRSPSRCGGCRRASRQWRRPLPRRSSAVDACEVVGGCSAATASRSPRPWPTSATTYALVCGTEPAFRRLCAGAGLERRDARLPAPALLRGPADRAGQPGPPADRLRSCTGVTPAGRLLRATATPSSWSRRRATARCTGARRRVFGRRCGCPGSARPPAPSSPAARPSATSARAGRGAGRPRRAARPPGDAAAQLLEAASAPTAASGSGSRACRRRRRRRSSLLDELSRDQASN